MNRDPGALVGALFTLLFLFLLLGFIVLAAASQANGGLQ